MRTWGHAAPFLDPSRQIGDLLIRKMLPRRHFQFGMCLSDGLEQQAFFRLARNQRWSAAAAVDHAIAVVQAQAPLGVGVRGMAVVAIVGEQRPNFLFEEIDQSGIVARRRLARGGPSRDCHHRN
jgi:hypothetical protein